MKKNVRERRTKMELPKEEIEVHKIGEQTKEIDMRVAGRPQDGKIACIHGA